MWSKIVYCIIFVFQRSSFTANLNFIYWCFSHSFVGLEIKMQVASVIRHIDLWSYAATVFTHWHTACATLPAIFMDVTRYCTFAQTF
jgi:hypothetical protein